MHQHYSAFHGHVVSQDARWDGRVHLQLCRAKEVQMTLKNS